MLTSAEGRARHQPQQGNDGHLPGADPGSLPAYPLVEAAHYLGLNASTLGSWFREGALLLADGDSDQMSFWNLVEAFVLKGLREEHRMSLQRIRVAFDELRRQYPKLTHPLAQLDLAVLNRDLYADRDGLLVDASRGGQLGIRGVLELYLSRVEKGPGGAIRLYPFTRPQLATAPRLVAIDPAVSFGRPVIAGTSIPSAVLHERWKAGDSIADLAEDYDRPVAEIEERHPHPASPAEKHALLTAGVRAFDFTSGSLSGAEMNDAVVKALPKTLALLASHPTHSSRGSPRRPT